ncbi:MAG: PEP-CTERM sorting domain-containing protein [Verrucomicrobiota bacterium]
MKKLYALIVLALGISASTNAAVLVEYNYDWAGTITASRGSSNLATGVSSASNMSFNGISGDGNPTNGYNNDWSIDDATNALYLNRSGATANGWGSPASTVASPLSFTITADAGFDVTVESLTLFVGSDDGENGGAADSPGTYTATVYFGSSNTAVGDYGAGVLFDDAETQTVSLASNFLISAGTAKTFYIDLDTNNNNSSHVLDSFDVNGTVAAIPEPSSFALMGAAAAFFYLLRRRV